MSDNGDSRTCFTIGHSNHSPERFAELLDEHDVSVVLDVRSVPYSRRNPQYNRETLRGTLSEKGYAYEFLGHVLGARGWGDEFMFTAETNSAKVDFSKIRSSKKFLEGIARVGELIDSGERPALMCAEGEPFDCHRFVLVSYQMVQEGFEVVHILPDGTPVSNSELEGRLLDTYVKPDLFSSPASYEEALEVAYEKRNLAL